MKSKIILLIISMIVTISAVAGATYAWFTDSATSSGNTFTTGTVDIQADRDLGDPAPGPMFYITNTAGAVPGAAPGTKLGKHETGLWYPGKTETRQLDVRNIGSLEVRINQVRAEITSINGDAPVANPTLATAFAQAMHMKISVAGQPTWILYEGSLENLLIGQTCMYKPEIAAFEGLPGTYPPVIQLSFEVTMLNEAGDILQGINPVVSFIIGAEQTANNP